jgi:ethanolamine utilization protein EutN
MRIAEVIGTVTLNRAHPSLKGLPLRLVTPLSLDNLKNASEANAEPLVAVDVLGAGLGSRIALSESAEAAAPFRPDIKPIDAYNAALLDHIELGGKR